VTFKGAANFLREVAKKIEELKKELADTKAKLLREGEWSRPMTKGQMGKILGLRPRAFNTFAKIYPLRKISRQMFQIRIDGMDSKTRRRLE
jgi:hypothetical protein